MLRAIELNAYLTYVSGERFVMPRTTQLPDRIGFRLRRDTKRCIITLTPAEWERFQDMLIDPPEPNRCLRKAFAEHARVVGR